MRWGPVSLDPRCLMTNRGDARAIADDLRSALSVAGDCMFGHCVWVRR